MGRLEQQLRANGHSTTSRLFRYLGHAPRWDAAMVLNAPRWVRRILTSPKPAVFMMGQPMDRAWCSAFGVPWHRGFDAQLEAMRAVIESSRNVAFISGYVGERWEGILGRRLLGRGPSVVFHGVPTGLFRPPATFPPQRPFVIGSVGAFRRRFRLESLFETSRRLQFDHRLLLVGSLDDECGHVLDAAMQDAELRSRTSYHPWRESAGLVPLLQRMHCLFHPVGGEGFGLAVAEALACGVPAVVTSLGGPAEYVPGGGVVVPFTPWRYDAAFFDRCAHAVGQVAAQWQDLSAGARLIAATRLDTRVITNRLLELLLGPDAVTVGPGQTSSPVSTGGRCD